MSSRFSSRLNMGKKVSDETKARIIKCRKDNPELSLARIAERFGMSSATVATILKSAQNAILNGKDDLK